MAEATVTLRRIKRSIGPAGILFLAAGCQTPAWIGAQKAQAPPASTASVDDQIIPGSTTHRKLSACIHEYVGFVFSVRPAAAVNKPSLRLEWPAATKPPEGIAVEILRIHPVHIDRFPGWHVRAIPPRLRESDPLDVLVPLNAPNGGMPGKLETNKEYFFWVEVVAEQAATAGNYLIPLVLDSAGKPIGRLEIDLTVWPVLLPEVSDLMALGEVEHVGLFRHHLPKVGTNLGSDTAWHHLPDSKEYDRVLNSTLEILQKHRVAPLLPELRPTIKVSPRGELNVDWSDYDRVVGPLLEGHAFENRVGLPAWPIPLQSVVSPENGYSLSAEDTQDLARQYVRQCAQHFQERGWLERSFAILDDPDDFTPPALARAKKANELVRVAGKDIRVASRRFPQDMKSYGWFGFPSIEKIDPDIWITNAQFFEARGMAGQRALRRQTWLGVDRPPFSGTAALLARPSDTLVLSWQAGMLGANHLWLGRINHWPDAGPKVDPNRCAQHDPRCLIFPGAAFGLLEPVPTLRLKRVRETMQHAAYVKLLQDHDRAHIADTLRRSLVDYAGTGTYRTHFMDGRPIGWPGKVQLFEAARQIMASEIMSLSNANTAAMNASSNMASELLWRSFTMKTEGLQMRVDGVRVWLVGTPLDRKFRVETSLTILTQGQSPARGHLELIGLPSTCTNMDRAQAIDLQPGKSQRLMLSMACDPACLEEVWNMDFAAQFVAQDHESVRTPVRMSLILAEPTVKPLTIDGDLSDWIAAANNVASDFRLIAGECEDSQQACSQPALRTFAFVRRDADFLYVAINAEARNDAGPRMRRMAVVYDDLIPMEDEDLVEILLDPLNGATRSPADLYHIVVKRSGVYLFEHGITTSPPLGPRSLWQADIEIASRAQVNRWTAEIRIPFAAFERPSKVSGEVWGFNLTHYNAGQQEFSTWSGALGNAYDPLSLGNLLLP